MLPVNLFMWLAAALPIIALLVTMVGLRWSAAKAAPVGLAIALCSGIFLYRAPLSLVAYECGKGLWGALSVLLVVFPAILLYEVTSEAKAFDVFRRGMQKFSPNELLQVITIGWVFVSFLQGITGFGVPVAVGAPLLVGIGVTPVYAVIIPLMGHAWANTFGTLGVAWNALVEATGLIPNSPEFYTTALWTAGFLCLINCTAGILMCWLYGKKKAIQKGLPAVLFISVIQSGGQLLLSQVNTTIAAFVPTVICLGAVLLLGRLPLYNKPWRIETSPCIDHTRSTEGKATDRLSFLEAFVPYFVLTAVTFICLVIKPVNQLLGAWKIGFAFPETITGYEVVNAASNLYSPIAPLTHAGMFLLFSSFVGYCFFKNKGCMKQGSAKTIVSNAWKKTIPSAISVILLLMMSKIMAGTGQTEVLAQGTAQVMKQFYALLAPFIGVLGSFMTSSNMASNILFAKFQQTTATLLGLNVWATLGAQTAGGAIGGIICPGNVVLGTTTAGIPGEEGTVLRRTIPIATGVAILIGIVLMVLVLVTI